MNTNTSIKVMYLNPVGSSDESGDQIFADMAKAYKYPNSSIDIASLNPASVPPKITDLEFRTYESYIINDTVKAARYASIHDYDAMVIGCFYDPALDAAREISNNSVIVAPCQAAITTVLNMAHNFSIIIGEWTWENQMRRTIYDYGYADKLASFKAIGMRVEDFQKDPSATKELIKVAALEAVIEQMAESIILGCTMEVGFYQEVQSFLKGEGYNVPVIDASIVALKSAENAALLNKCCGWQNSRVWGMQPPPEQQLKDFDILQSDYKFGNIINIPPST